MNCGFALALLLAVGEGSPWLRAHWTDDHATLEIASRAWSPQQGGHPLWLVGVAHIGDENFYRAVNAILEESDTVVFESVLPEGGMPPSEALPAERVEATQSTARLLATLLSGGTASHWNHRLAQIAEQDPRGASMARSLSRDGWGQPWHLVQRDEAWKVVSLGSDGQPGGEGEAADITVAIPEEKPIEAPGALQRTMADSLALTFQIDAMPYGNENWVPGDISIDQMEAAFAAHDLEVGDLGGLLQEEGFMGGMLSGILKMIPMLDAMLGGRIRDTMRVVLIEMLSQEELIDAVMKQQGEAFAHVLLDLRNQRAAEVARVKLRDGSVALVYGAAHMEGLESLLIDDQWALLETRWLPAITLDIRGSALSPMEVEMLRRWVRSTTGSMMQ